MTIESEGTETPNGEPPQQELFLRETLESCRSYLNDVSNLMQSDGEFIFEFKVENNGNYVRGLSPPIVVRGLPWRVLIGQNFVDQRSRNPTKFLAVMILCDLQYHSLWSCLCSYKLLLKNFINENDNLGFSSQDNFCWKETVFGNNKFLPMDELFKTGSPYVKDDHFKIHLQVHAEAPNGIFWDSKKVTGHLGLRNQGATCYLNSLLQTLFFTNHFRKTVFLIPTEFDDPKKSVVLSLQWIFYQLQNGTEVVDTKKLTTAFGWDLKENFIQHDVQEMCRILIDKIEEKMKGTLAEKAIPQLLGGTLTSYINCTNVAYESTREEQFMDIQLNIKGKANVYESFYEYCGEELLEGDNMYRAGDFGLQEARKGVIFKKLPPVLHLHLLRFQYNPITNCYYKINDRYEFPCFLDLDDFVSECGEHPAHYCLQSILVHSGDNHGGHYVVFISPKCDGKWYKFDDEVVSQVTTDEAITNNYGQSQIAHIRASTNAYMLAYIRKDQIPVILDNVTNSNIRPAVLDIIKAEENYMKLSREFAEISDSLVEIDIITDDELFRGSRNRLVDFSQMRPIKMIIQKNVTFAEAIDYICSQLGYKRDLVIPWLIEDLTTPASKPCYVLPEDYDIRISNLSVNWKFVVYLEYPSSGVPLIRLKDHVLFLCHFFDPELQKLFYCNHITVNRDSDVMELTDKFKILFNMASNIELEVYLETYSYGVSKFPGLKIPIGEVVGCSSGMESVVFQISNTFTSDLQLDDIQYPFNTVKGYLEDIKMQISIPFFEISTYSESHFCLNLPRSIQYNQIGKLMSPFVGVDSAFIRFYKDRAIVGVSNHIRADCVSSFEEISNETDDLYHKHKIYYQILDVPAVDIDDRIYFPFKYLEYGSNDEINFPLFLTQNYDYECVIQEAKKKNFFMDKSHQSLRIVVVDPRKIHKIIDQSFVSQIATLSNTTYLRIEPVPEDQILLNDSDRLICVSFIAQGSYLPSPPPILFKISSDDTFGSLKSRIVKLTKTRYNNDNIDIFTQVEGRDHKFPDDRSCYRNYCSSFTTGLHLFCENGLITKARIVVFLLHNVALKSRSYKAESAVKINN